MPPADLWNPSQELFSGEALRTLQIERLRRQLAYLYHSSDYYRMRIDQAGVKPEAIRY